MQIGGCIMETGGIPEEIPSPSEMGVIVKREPKETSPILSETPESTPEIESPDGDHWSLSSFSIKNETASNEDTRDTSDNITIYKIDDTTPAVVSVIQKNENVQIDESPKSTRKIREINNATLKSQLKIHLEANLLNNQKKSLNLQDEIHKQQNLLINREERNKFFDHEKLTKMFSIIAPKKDPNESQQHILSSTSAIGSEKSGQSPQILDDKKPLSLESLPHESIKCWLQRIAQLQKHSSVLEITPEINSLPLPANKTTDSKRKIQSAQANIVIPQQSTTRIVNYRDLPYMGEMTLDNCKPRRGRKPKKADICHLIYKNYGTIIPGNPQNVTEHVTHITDSSSTSVDKKTDHSSSTSRTDVQNKIISSLLEKRLTLETKKNKDSKTVVTENGSQHVRHQEEPLNLCIRDLNQLKIRLLRRHDNIYESKKDPDILPVEIKSEPQSDDEVEFVNETKPPNSSVIQKVADVSTSNSPEISNDKTSPDTEVAPGGYVFWPNAGVFVHPMALQSQMLYYQKLVANNNLNMSSPNSRPSSNASSNSSSLQTSKKPETPTSPNDNHETKTKRTTNPQSSTAPPPTKRKRSAIFIPPIPTENQTNPATEVSICKFKFTGGAKPSLQEKKMLSVDSGGNFRYYSGTGDKSMRGYEFFPRETLQQQAITQNTSSSGVFLNASGEKISIPTHLTDVNSPPGIRPHFLLSADPLLVNTDPLSPHNTSSDHHSSLRHRKRKTRKSLQREKLEQTFKEKGFLIQTQQLESAEGATYCKFRQLRKFTRYLFRSWKDYLPGNVRDMQMENGAIIGTGGGASAEIGDKSDDEFDITSSNNQGPIVGDDVSVNSDLNISNRTNT